MSTWEETSLTNWQELKLILRELQLEPLVYVKMKNCVADISSKPSEKPSVALGL